MYEVATYNALSDKSSLNRRLGRDKTSEVKLTAVQTPSGLRSEGLSIPLVTKQNRILATVSIGLLRTSAFDRMTGLPSLRQDDC